MQFFRDNIEDPLEDLGTVAQQLEQVTVLLFKHIPGTFNYYVEISGVLWQVYERSSSFLSSFPAALSD